MKDNGERKTAPNRCAMTALPCCVHGSHHPIGDAQNTVEGPVPRGSYHRNLHKKAAANNLSTAALVLMR
jgi:hypothetical protein